MYLQLVGSFQISSYFGSKIWSTVEIAVQLLQAKPPNTKETVNLSGFTTSTANSRIISRSLRKDYSIPPALEWQTSSNRNMVQIQARTSTDNQFGFPPDSTHCSFLVSADSTVICDDCIERSPGDTSLTEDKNQDLVIRETEKRVKNSHTPVRSYITSIFDKSGRWKWCTTNDIITPIGNLFHSFPYFCPAGRDTYKFRVLKIALIESKSKVRMGKLAANWNENTE